MTQASIHWVFYTSELGPPVVRKEIEKLQLRVDELQKLEKTLRRISAGTETWRDSDYLGGEIWEVRLRLQHKQVRVLYSVETSLSIHLALLAAIKKVQKTPRQWIDTSIKRRKDWLRRVNDDS